jgi:hypothetical protein
VNGGGGRSAPDPAHVTTNEPYGATDPALLTTNDPYGVPDPESRHFEQRLWFFLFSFPDRSTFLPKSRQPLSRVFAHEQSPHGFAL